MTNKRSKPAFKKTARSAERSFPRHGKTPDSARSTVASSSRARRELLVIEEKIEAARKRYSALVRKKEIGLKVKNTRVPVVSAAPPRRKSE